MDQLDLPAGVRTYDPALAIDILQYREEHPSLALICDGEWQGESSRNGMLLYEGPAREIGLLHMALNKIGDRMYVCIMPSDWMVQLGINLEPQKDKEHTYKLERVTEHMFLAGSCNPIHLCEISGLASACIYGSLRRLFGEPDYETNDSNDMYGYTLRAVREDGREAFLRVDSSGVSSLPEDADMKEGAAFVLKQMIDETPPADYSYEGFYWDGPNKLEYGVKDGEPYYREWPLDEFETEQLFSGSQGL